MRSRLVHDDVFRRLIRARDFMRECHADSLDLGTMARQACLSPYHFLRQFTRAFGQTPRDYLTRVRLERAKQFLMADNLPVTEVCLEVGFTSLGSFSTLFSRQIGLSPNAYRRKMSRIYHIPAIRPRIVVPHCFLSQLFGVPALPMK